MPAERSALLQRLLSAEVSLRRRAGERFALDRYFARFPDDRETVATAFLQIDRDTNSDSTCDLAGSFESATQSVGSVPAASSATPSSSQRYRKVHKLGEGSFGSVWLAEDLELNRQVALKEPRAMRLRDAADVETYLAEARVLASLDHPHIVPVYDVGRTADGSCYVVSKLIDGADLGVYVHQMSISFAQAASLVAQIAEALQHTHNRGLVHRDIKPANILIDGQNRPYITDFGLAMRDENLGKHEGIAGTPAYMSPEQARGESHLVDGRSDIFSLGVVLYELLVGAKPFRGDNWPEIRQQITTVDPKPLRQVNAAIPKELERICLKALSKRASDRYVCAADLANELSNWSSPTPADSSPQTPPNIVPKGLRSFDTADRDFFLELLPGPRDRDGLPESLRFWKTRIEETDADRTFRVGLVYGPSGCGKSSMIKAGLLPRLAGHVLPVFLEATPHQTEQQLLKGLRRAAPDLPHKLSLVDTLAAIRRGKGIPVGRKIVLVMDQFEQWLSVHGTELNSDLVAALRQCDGDRIQAVLLVRDDFWMPISEFLRSLEVRLLEGVNANAVSLFDPLHARKVLSEFGRAYGRLPANLEKISRDQDSFLSKSIAGLTQNGKVISVRLALFADLMKSRPWTPASLAEVGGTAGVGSTFLEESFSSQAAPPQHRQHQDAARAVLHALLPGVGTEIKGHMRTASELCDACGYSSRPQDFADLIRILDSDLRLITPVTNDCQTPAYQLTHDYLVPSLRNWLTRKRRESRRGRAELCLQERGETWNAKPEQRFLPSPSEYLGIYALTDRRSWAPGERRMMSQATRFYAIRSSLAALAIFAVLAVGLTIRDRIARRQEATRIQGLVGQLISADPNQIPEIVKQLPNDPVVWAPMLAPHLATEAKTADQKRAQLHARLATVGRDPSLVAGLKEDLLTSKVTYLGPIRELLRPYASQLTRDYLNLLGDESAPPERRFRAALALADYLSESALWPEPQLKFVAEQLVSANAEFQPTLRSLLRPIHPRLLPFLQSIFGDAKSTDAQRLSAANAFADYAAHDVSKLSELLLVATPAQDALLFPLVAANPAASTVEDFGKLIASLPAAELGSAERISHGQLRANAAVTLLRLGDRGKVLPVFEMTDDPEALTQFIFRCRERGVRVDELLECLHLVSNGPRDRYPANARFALLLGLGEYSLEEIPASQRDALLKQLSDWYRHDPSSGVHGAAGWLLRHWGLHDIVRQVDQTAVPYAADCEWFTLAITVTPTPPQSDASPADPVEPQPPKTFYYTFIVYPAGDSLVGAFVDEPGREKDEVRHAVTLTRPFALLDREITMEELIAFSPRFTEFMQRYDANPPDAGFAADWYDAVSFCRWLSRQSGMAESDQAYADPESLDKAQYPLETNPQCDWAPRSWPIALDRRGFRLPTESEWEIASRAGARTAFGFGSDVALLPQFGWFIENSGEHPHPPRELRPSLRGLFDVHGNLFEWTHDWYTDYPIEPTTDPHVSTRGSDRVIRGGSWDFEPADSRTAGRLSDVPSGRANNVGIRLALTIPTSPSPPAKEDQ